MKTLNEKINDARELLRENGYFVQNLWSDIDVNQMLEDRNLSPFDKEKAVEFFDFVGSRHDAGIGINWDSLSIYLDEFLSE